MGKQRKEAEILSQIAVKGIQEKKREKHYHNRF
jgi:hypothetical protein